MFSNNNNAVIKKLAKKSLKSNKRRNIYVIITIAIAVCLMASMALLMLGYKQDKINNIDGMYQAAFFNVDQNTLKNLKKDPFLDSAGEYKAISEKRIDDYILKSIYMDEDTLRLGKVQWEGALPKKTEEIMLEKAYVQKLGKSISLRDTIFLNLGDGEKEYHVTGFFEHYHSVDNSMYTVIRSHASCTTKDDSGIVYIRIKDSNHMYSQELEKAIFKAAQQHNIPTTDISESSIYFNVIKPINKSDLLLIIVISILVAFGASLVIYSIFYISVTGKVREYGQLRTIGTTKKQIKKMIFREGCQLSVMGITIGLIAANLIAIILIPKGWNISNVIGASLTVAVLTFIVVSFAINKPMKIAASTSPLESIRYSAASETMKVATTKKLYRKLTPLQLAIMNFSRNRKKSILTLVSLGFSGILIICAATYNNSLSIEAMSRGALFAFGDYQLTLTSKNNDNSDGYAISRIQQNNPLDQELKQQIFAIEGVKKIKVGEATKIRFSVPNGKMTHDYISGFSLSDSEEISKNLKLGKCDYEKCRDEKGIIVMAADVLKEVYSWEPALGEKVILSFYTSSGIVSVEYTILGITDSRLKEGSFLIPKENLQNVMGINVNNTFSIEVDPEKKDTVKKDLLSIEKTNLSLNLKTLDDIIADKRVENKNVFTIVYAILLVIALFGIINLVNTVITNILTRKQELGMLQAIGMSNKQLHKMLQSEGMLFTLSTIIITFTLGNGLGWLLCEYIRRTSNFDYIKYRFPLLQISLFTAVLLITQIMISYFSVRSLKKQSMIEQIREV